VFKTLTHGCAYIVITLGSSALLGATTFSLPDGSVLQDPTKPQLWQVPTQVRGQQLDEPTFTLNYIVASEQEKRAMINGHKVVEGDVIAGAKVKQINSDSVYLIYKGKQKELRMNKVKGITRN
jgi:type II secretory pathway component PulC